MTEQSELQIGARLRAARQRQGLTVERVAQMSGLTKGFVSRVERDMTSPSVATLVTLCQTLSVPMGELFADPRSDLIRAEDAPTINLSGEGAREQLLTPRDESHLQLIRSTMPPGSHGGEGLYTLNAEVEVLHVLEGTVEIQFTNRVERLEAGDTITFSGREPHTWRNREETTAHVLWIIAPAAWH